MTDAPEWHKRRVAGMPETIFVSEARVQPDGFDARRYNYTAAVQYVRADILEAAQARIEALQDTLNIERALSDGAHKRARNTRRDAYAECAAIADDWYHRSGHGSPGDDIRATLEALEKGDNHGVG